MDKINELHPELIGASALNPDRMHDSSPREAMYLTQLGQTLVVDGSEPRFNMTGMEDEYGKYTFDIRMPENATILRVFKKYPPRLGVARDNPELTVLYEVYEEERRIGVLKIPRYGSFHQDFGFPYVRNEDATSRLQSGEMLAKDTVLAHSPAVKHNGQYALGLEANVAFMSVPSTIEDGFCMSESFLKRMGAHGYNTVSADWGKRYFPLNLYGDDEHYKPYPDIGERIRDDGLLFALREFDENLTVTEMTPKALQSVDHSFDRLFWATANAEVIDVTVYHDERLNPKPTPTGMEAQAAQYHDDLINYYQQIWDEYTRLKGRRGHRLQITPEFNQLLTEAQTYLNNRLPNNRDQKKLTLMYRLDQLDEWYVNVTYRYPIDPTNGFKFSDCHGGNEHCPVH